MKPTWESECGRVQLYCADCLDVLPTLGKVDAVVTDPPYGVDLGSTKGAGGKHGLIRGAYSGFVDSYENFVSEVVPRINTALDTSKRAAVFSGPHLQEQRKASAIGGVFCPCGCGRHCWGFKTFLPVLFYGIAPDLQHGAKHNTLQSTAIAEKNDHPCPKPLPWMEWLVSLSSTREETILDPFMGSGTTGVAAIKLGRKFIGIEKDPKYFDIAVDRIARALADSVTLWDAAEMEQQQGELAI